MADPTPGPTPEPEPETNATAFELPEAPEDYELADGSTVVVATDVVHYGHADREEDRPKTTVPFAVQLTRPDGHVTEIECESEEETHDVHRLVVLLDELGYRRG